MKKISFFLIASFLICSASYAEDSKRLKELKSEQEKIVSEYNQNQSAISELQAKQGKLTEKLLLNQGAINELTRGDKKEADGKNGPK